MGYIYVSYKTRLRVIKDIIIVQVFANPEDIKGNAGAKVDYANEDVERVRRCHQVRKKVFEFLIKYKQILKIF